MTILQNSSYFKRLICLNQVNVRNKKKKEVKLFLTWNSKRSNCIIIEYKNLIINKYNNIIKNYLFLILMNS